MLRPLEKQKINYGKFMRTSNFSHFMDAKVELIERQPLDQISLVRIFFLIVAIAPLLKVPYWHGLILDCK